MCVLKPQVSLTATSTDTEDVATKNAVTLYTYMYARKHREKRDICYCVSVTVRSTFRYRRLPVMNQLASLACASVAGRIELRITGTTSLSICSCSSVAITSCLAMLASSASMPPRCRCCSAMRTSPVHVPITSGSHMASAFGGTQQSAIPRTALVLAQPICPRPC